MRPALPRSAATLALLALVLLPLPARADLLVNGNFENGPAIPLANPLFTVAPGSTALTGWTVTSGAIQIVTDNYWVPLSGHRSVELSATGPGSIEQKFPSATGAIYRLTFWLSGEPFSTPTLKHLQVDAGAVTQHFAFDTTPAWEWDMAWAVHTLEFPAPGSATTVRFTSEDATQWGPAIDSTKVELVSAGVPDRAALAFAGVTPDPVRVAGRVTFSLATPGHARLAVYDVQGREQALLADGTFGAGTHSLEFAPSAWGARAGLFLAVLSTGGRTLVRRFTVLP